MGDDDALERPIEQRFDARGKGFPIANEAPPEPIYGDPDILVF